MSGLIPKEATAKEILAEIDDWASRTKTRMYYGYEGTNETRALWDILTALRGPDFKPSWIAGELEPNPKAMTTAVIRGRALPVLADGYADVNSVTPLYEARQYTDDQYSRAGTQDGPSFGHFLRHAKRALAALE